MPHNQGVAGSCPAGTTKKHLRQHRRCFFPLMGMVKSTNKAVFVLLILIFPIKSTKDPLFCAFELSVYPFRTHIVLAVWDFFVIIYYPGASQAQQNVYTI